MRPSAGSVSVCGSGAARAALGYLAELFRFPGWCTADELLELHQRLARSGGGVRERSELLELAEVGGVALWLWSAAYVVLAGAAALWAFSRRDL